MLEPPVKKPPVKMTPKQRQDMFKRQKEKKPPTKEEERIEEEIKDSPNIGYKVKFYDDCSKKKFYISYCLPYGHWKDCKIKFNVIIEKDYPDYAPNITLEKYKLSKEKKVKGLRIIETNLEKKSKIRLLRKWNLTYNMTDLCLGLRDLLHTRSFIFDGILYEIQISSTITHNHLHISPENLSNQIENKNPQEDNGNKDKPSPVTNEKKRSLLLKENKLLANRTQNLQKYISNDSEN